MSVVDKLKLVAERRAELNASLDAGAQKLLDRYDEISKKADVAFDRHHARLTAEEAAADELGAAVDRLSNDMGNLQG